MSEVGGDVDSDVEKVACEVALLWQQLLGVDRVENGDDFFELGGNSIAAVRATPLIDDRFGVETTISLIFDNPTPRALARVLVDAGDLRSFDRRGDGGRPDHDVRGGARVDERILAPEPGRSGSEAFDVSFAGAMDELVKAYEQVPFYGPHLDAAGLRPGDIRGPADFRRVPPTTKADYRRHFPAGVLVRGSTLADDFVFRSQSSGTTGERLVTLAHTFTLAQRQMRTASVNEAMQRVFTEARPRRVCRYAPPACSSVECATPSTTMASRTLDDGTLVLPVAHDLLATPPELVEQAVSELRDYHPQWIDTDPAHLAFLLDGIHERGRPAPEVSGVVLAYNLATGAVLRRIRDRLPEGTVVVEAASMSELGWLGMTCPHGHLHLNTDSFYLELLAHGTARPAEPGELAELCVTSIGDQLSPHIRYRTGDGYVLLDGDCPCGHRFPRAVHHGRCRDYVTADGEVVLTPRTLDDLVGPAEWLSFYKLTHRDTGPLLLRYIPVAGAEHAGPAGRLAAAIRRRTGREVDVTAVGHIESERSGKLFGCVRETR